jgi:hypothetical protein
MAVKKFNSTYRHLLILAISFIVILFSACNNDGDITFGFNELDFTYSAGMGGLYSIKIDPTGNFLLGKGRPPNKIYFGKLSNEEKLRLDSIYNATSFEKFDTLYSNSTADLSSYSICIASRGNIKCFTVLGSNKEPEKLKLLSEYLVYLIYHVKATPKDTIKDTIITFKSLDNVYKKPPPPNK